MHLTKLAGNSTGMAKSAIDSSKTIKTWISPLQLINDRQSLRIRSGWFPIIGFASPRCDPALVHPFSAFASAAFTPMDSQPANNGVPMNKKGSHLRRRLFRGLSALLTLRYFLTRHVRLHLKRLTHDPVELLGAHAQFANGLRLFGFHRYTSFRCPMSRITMMMGRTE